MKELLMIFMMTTTLSHAQNNDLLADGKVEPIHYTSFNNDRSGVITRMDVIRRDNKSSYVIRIAMNDNIDYWYFNLQNAKLEDHVLFAPIDSTVTYNQYNQAHVDRQANGRVVSNRNTGLETIDFHFHVPGVGINHFVLQWKISLDNHDDSVNTYMRNRPAVTSEEKQNRPPKKWKTIEAEKLMNQIGYYPISDWYYEGKNSAGRYAYSLDFSPTGEIRLSHLTETAYQNGKWLDNIYVAREGTFEIEGDTIEINFLTLLGSRYNRPNLWNDPLKDSLTLKLKVELQNESDVGRKLIVRQISGTNIFENNSENDTLIFTATLLPTMSQ